MTTEEIKYELFECLVTIRYIKDIVAEREKDCIETVEDRLYKLLKFYGLNYNKESKTVGDEINKIIKP